jgi:hypothetical protein
MTAVLAHTALEPALLHFFPQIALGGYQFMVIEELLGWVKELDPVFYWYLCYEHYICLSFSDVSSLVPIHQQAEEIFGPAIYFPMALSIFAYHHRHSHFMKVAGEFFEHMNGNGSVDNDEDEDVDVAADIPTVSQSQSSQSMLGWAWERTQQVASDARSGIARWYNGNTTHSAKYR